MADVHKAGHALRRLREQRNLTQRDVERLTRGQVIAQQVSRLENGGVSKPPMEDLVVLGRIYDLTPTDMARLYGYLDERRQGVTNTQENLHELSVLLRRVQALAVQLPEHLRLKLTQWLDLILVLLSHEMNTSE